MKPSTLALCLFAALIGQVKPPPQDPGPVKQMAEVLQGGFIRMTPSDPGFIAASQFAGVPLAVELEPGLLSVGADDRIVVNRGEKFGDLLWRINARFTNYHPFARYGVINVAPSTQASDPNAFLNTSLTAFSALHTTVLGAIMTLRKALDSSYSAGPVVDPGDGLKVDFRKTVLAQEVSIDCAPCTARQILDAIMRQAERFTWVTSYSQGPPIEQWATIRVVGLDGGTATFSPRIR